MRVAGALAIAVACSGCAQLLGIHDRDDGGSSSGCTDDVIDVQPELAIPGVMAFTPRLVSLSANATTPEFGVAWCEAGGLLKFATLGLDGTPGPIMALGGQCFDQIGQPLALAATDSTFAVSAPDSNALYVLDATGAQVGSPVMISWTQGAVRGTADGFVAVAITLQAGDHFMTQSLPRDATAFTAVQFMPNDAACCSPQRFDGAITSEGDLLAVWVTTSGGVWNMDRLRAPGFSPDPTPTVMSGISGTPRLTPTSLGVLLSASCTAYQFVTNSGSIGPLLPAPDALTTDCGVAATGDQIRIARPSNGVVSWHALDPSTGAGPESLTIATGGSSHSVASDHRHGFGVVWPLAGGIGYAHVELCSR